MRSSNDISILKCDTVFVFEEELGYMSGQCS